MALTYNTDIRNLSIKGTITMTTGKQIHLTTDDIIRYSFDSSIGSEGLPLGSAEAASFTLEISNVNKEYTPAQFDNAEVHMFVGIMNDDQYVYSDFGVWYVDSSSAPEQSVSITLSGYDALATRFESFYEDDATSYPTTIGDIVETVCLAAGIELKTANFPNAAVQVASMPVWGEDITLRDILSYCAICAGGYVRIARNGQLEIVGFADGHTYEIDPDTYWTFTLTGGTAFKFNAIEALLAEDAEEYTRYAVDDEVKSNATNTIQIEYNPLLTDAILQSVVAELNGIQMDAGTLTWGGDPSVQLTDYYDVTMLDGATRKIMVTSQSFSFDGGMSVTESCELPAINTVSSATYSTSANMYDAKGNLKATRISGLNKTIINATIGHFKELTSDTAQFDELLASYLEAVNLVANVIDAAVLKSGSVTADKIAAGSVTADKLEADIVDSVSIEAVLASITGALTANDINANTLSAELAKFTSLAAAQGEFDQAAITHLVSQSMNLGYGEAGQVFINNLAVKYANMVSAAVGELCIKASDGNYYLLDVTPDGGIIATNTTVTDGEIATGETSGGKVILETNIAATNLNTSNLLATYALINRIDAAQIDVDELFAREAFVGLLRTTKIVGDDTITIIAERSNKSFRQEDMPSEGVKLGDTWRIPSTGETYQAVSASDVKLNFYLDEEGNLSYELDTLDDTVSLQIQGYDLNVENLVIQNGVEPIRWVIVRDEGMLSKLEFQHYVRLESDGLHVGVEENTGEVLIDHDSVDVVVNGRRFSSFAANYVEFGNYQLRKTADGGLVFKVR